MSKAGRELVRIIIKLGPEVLNKVVIQVQRHRSRHSNSTSRNKEIRLDHGGKNQISGFGNRNPAPGQKLGHFSKYRKRE